MDLVALETLTGQNEDPRVGESFVVPSQGKQRTEESEDVAEY